MAKGSPGIAPAGTIPVRADAGAGKGNSMDALARLVLLELLVLLVLVLDLLVLLVLVLL